MSRIDLLKEFLVSVNAVIDAADQHGQGWPQYPELHSAIDGLREGKAKLFNALDEHERNKKNLTSTDTGQAD